MDLFVQHMVQRFHDQITEKMSPERRARDLSPTNDLLRPNLRVKNRENEGLLNNNMATSYAFKHSTPLKREQVTDLDMVDSTPSEDAVSTDEGIYPIYEGEDSESRSDEEISEAELVIAKVYELPPSLKNSPVLSSLNRQDAEATRDYEVEVTEAELSKAEDLDTTTNTVAPWKSLEVLDETAEFEFLKTLEQSKQYMSTSNLLEEIEADLPPRYSLAKPLNHTFHSLTSYRTVTRLARMEKNLTCVEDLENGDKVEGHSPLKRVERLETEAMVQQAKIKQAQKALNLSRAKKSMEVENLESEKTLLLANLRFSAACQEIEKLKLLRDVGEKENFGQMTISGVQYAIDETQKNVAETFICTATDRENVQVSSTLYKLDGKLCFDEPMKFQNLAKDFVIYIELYRREIKGTKTPMKACILKKLKELAGHHFHKTLSITPAYNNHGFECVACGQLRLEHISKRVNDKCCLNFNEPPRHPITSDTITVRVKTDFNTQSKKCGFLNVFKSTWHRLWYSQTGHFLNSWLYPEDQENDKPPIESIYLSNCKETVKPADLEVCIRPHSFVLTVGPDREEILFSADSKKEMLKWMEHLNLVIEHIRIWRPNV